MLKFTDICQEIYLKELYFLKRNLYSTYDEFKKNRLLVKEDNSLKFFKNYARIYSDCETFKKKSEFENYCLESKRKLIIKFDGDPIEITRNMFLILARTSDDKSQSEKIWLEILENESSLVRILDIHLTAKYLVERFKELKHPKLRINIAKINRLSFGSKCIVFLCIDEDLRKAEIKNTNDRFKSEAMECFTHFTYEKTNRNLICIDLRTLNFNNGLLITEPVIFSLIPERFSSSDLGFSGIENFKNSHKCNEYCKDIGLNKF